MQEGATNWECGKEDRVLIFEGEINYTHYCTAQVYLPCLRSGMSCSRVRQNAGVLSVYPRSGERGYSRILTLSYVSLAVIDFFRWER
jgi:hypothetical protein